MPIRQLKKVRVIDRGFSSPLVMVIKNQITGAFITPPIIQHETS